MGVIAAACSAPDYTVPRENEASGGKTSRGGANGTDATSLGGNDGIGGDGSSLGGGAAVGGGAAKSSCRSAEDCSTRHAARQCDTATGSCVQCLPGMTSCGAGLYCGSDKECHVGCAANADCSTGTCDSLTHQCIGCSTNADCSLGTSCDEATRTCVAGCDGAGSCPDGFICCANGCVNVYLDEGNCGSCGTSCSRPNSTTACQDAICVLEQCKEGYGDCNAQVQDGCEADLLAQASNCGACSNACSDSLACRRGVCASPECGQGYVDCDGESSNGCETNTERDIENCGACDSACSTAFGVPSCAAGVCTMTCSSGWGDCDQNPNNGCEADLSTNAAHCGRCAVACVNDHGGVECASGRCAPNCGTGFGDCDAVPANGCEAPLLTDASNCGACGKICSLPHAIATCTTGRCTVGTCVAGWGDCNGLPDDGCEANLQSDPTHCGTCDVGCSSNNGTASCNLGQCSIACTSGFGNCDEVATNGCEVNLAISVAHCATCSHPCPVPSNGSATCDQGVCGVSSCAAPYSDCDKNLSNGCESNSKTDVNNCGGCGTPCNLAHATATCSNGTCAIANCAEGWGDCNGVVTDGCEVNLLSSLTHCGGCTAACAPAEAVPACLAGKCTIASCSSGYQDCNKDVIDGCEVNTQTSVGNCGGCAAACSAVHGTPSCAGGNCSIVCAAGYGNCDGDVSTGCETSTTSSADHCNGCGKPCAPKNGTGACENAACVITSCNTSFEDCDATYSPGCEVNLTTDTSNCNSCKKVCDASNGDASCSASGCNITCNTDYADCTTAPGCETNTLTDENNCGGCGKRCGTECIAGVCATPCTGICSNPTVFTIPKPGTYLSPELGAWDICYETASSITGGGCSNFEGRTASVNRIAQANCGSWTIPAARNGGFCISAGSGRFDFATFNVW